MRQFAGTHHPLPYYPRSSRLFQPTAFFYLQEKQNRGVAKQHPYFHFNKGCRLLQLCKLLVNHLSRQRDITILNHYLLTHLGEHHLDELMLQW